MEFLGSGGMYFRGNFKRKEKNRKGKEKEKKVKEGGGCQQFPNKFYGVQRSRTSRTHTVELTIYCDENNFTENIFRYEAKFRGS